MEDGITGICHKSSEASNETLMRLMNETILCPALACDKTKESDAKSSDIIGTSLLLVTHLRAPEVAQLRTLDVARLAKLQEDVFGLHIPVLYTLGMHQSQC